MLPEPLPLLSLIIWLPIIGGVLVLIRGEDRASQSRWLSLIVAMATLLLSLLAVARFDYSTWHMQFAENAAWITSLHINYGLGVDGIALPLIVLTSIVGVLVIIAGWQSVTTRVAQYNAALLILEGLMIGMFSATDAMLFYLFFEAQLIPMFLIIGIWGGPRRVYATIKFFLYTFLGSVFLLLGLIYLYIKGGSFDIATLYGLPLTATEQYWLFLGFLAGFAVKIPMFPIHTWLPDAHVEAPTGGSVILAAIMLKIAGYGFIRFSLPILPLGSLELGWIVITLSLIAIVYISLVALAQHDMKKLIAYSSISHMGFVTLGLFIPFGLLAGGSGSAPDAAMSGIDGAMVQMVSHGFISAALFLVVGVLYDRVHSREISAYGGVANRMPWFAALAVFFAMGNAGLPGTSGFVGEFLVIMASFQANVWFAVLAGSTLVLGAAYTLYMVRRVFYGEVANDEVAKLKDLKPGEAIVLGTLALLVLVLGVWPNPLMNMFDASVHHLVEHISAALPA